MDIDHPDPGTTSQFTFFAETPVDAEAFVLMGAGEAVAAETAPPPYCSGVLNYVLSDGYNS